MDGPEKFFGTIGPSEKLPADMARAPMESQGAVARMYCNKCSVIYELNAEQLTNVTIEEPVSHATES